MSAPPMAGDAHRPSSKSLRIAAHGATDPGVVREENQDAFTILEPGAVSQTLGGARPERGTLLVLADGMGGLAGGATASNLAIEAVREGYRDAEAGMPPAQALKAAVCRANLLIYAHAEGLPDQEPMGSTVTAMAIIDGYACIAHVGDSRAYRISAHGPIRRLTKDHTWVEELAKRGELDPHSLQYTLHRNVLTRGLGLRGEVEVDVVELNDVAPGDAFLLCSDGLHEMVDDEEIESRLRARGMDLAAAATDLINLARDRGGPDNITVVIGRVEKPADAAASEVEPPEEEIDLPRGASAPRIGRRIFPRSALMPLSWFAAFALGVGAVLLLEGPPPSPEPLRLILEDPAFRELFDTEDGQRLRNRLSSYLREVHRRER